MRVLIAVLLAIATMASTAAAREFIVAPTGDDANPGTLDQPFATLRQACSVARAGDTIALRAGDYPSSTYWDAGGNGTPTAHITVRAYDGPRTARTGAFSLHGKQYLD